MKNKKQTNQKKPESRVVLFIALAILLIAILLALLITPNRLNENNVLKLREKPEQFETLQETETTPEEINNEVVEELDELIQSIDQETTDEDLSDLDL